MNDQIFTLLPDAALTALTAQYIDSMGKTRILFIGEIPLILLKPIRPLPYINSINVSENDIIPLKIEEVYNLLKLYILKVEKVIHSSSLIYNDDIVEDRYYVKTENFFIPVEKITSFKVGNDTNEIELEIEPDPLFTDSTSKLLEYRYQKKITDYLEYYTLNYYVEVGEKPDFEIIEDHSYDLQKLNGKFYLPGNEADGVIYYGSNIIVLSELMERNLISYLETQIVNGYKPILEGGVEISNKIDVYRDIYDYRISNNFLVFNSVSDLVRYTLTNKNTTEVSKELKSDTNIPYFYYNKNVDSNPVLIQPSTTLENSLRIASYWNDNKVNIGNSMITQVTIKPIDSYKVFDFDNNTISKYGSESNNSTANNILLYKQKYSAILIL